MLACFSLVMQAEGRIVQSFNSGWVFKKAPAGKELAVNAPKWESGWTEVEIPHTWNAKDMQVQFDNFYEGPAYYKKHYFFPAELKDKRVFLRFEGVGAVAEVYVNGSLVTTHKGAYSAFSCEIGTVLKPGADNEIIVKADNTSRPDVIPINHVLFGVYGGMYRPVWLIVTDPYNICVTDCASSGVYITQKNVSKKQADVKVKVKLDNGTLHPVPLTLQNTIYNQEGKQVATQSRSFDLTAQGVQSFEADFKIKNPILWQGRKNPYLYKVVSRLIQNGKVIDEVVEPLGLRRYEIVAGKGFYLNGEKYPMYGVTRHQDWWGLGSALKNENHDFDLATIMDIGATTVRFAHYQQSVRVVERLEKGGAGLNLTWEVRNGIACHTKGTPAATLEGQIVRLADHIAYINHDIEDALRGKIIYPMDIPLEISCVLGFTHSQRIGTLVTDAIQASRGQGEIRQSPEVGEAMLALKDFMFDSVYTNPAAKGEEGKAQDMLRCLFEYYQKTPDRLPDDFQSIRVEEGVDRAVCDYIAGMTDPFAVGRFQELFIPKGWTVM